MNPRIELRLPTLQFEKDLLISFVVCSLPDHILYEVPVLCQFFYLFCIPDTFAPLTGFLDKV